MGRSCCPRLRTKARPTSWSSSALSIRPGAEEEFWTDFPKCSVATATVPTLSGICAAAKERGVLRALVYLCLFATLTCVLATGRSEAQGSPRKKLSLWLPARVEAGDAIKARGAVRGLSKSGTVSLRRLVNGHWEPWARGPLTHSHYTVTARAPVTTHPETIEARALLRSNSRRIVSPTQHILVIPQLEGEPDPSGHAIDPPAASPPAGSPSQPPPPPPPLAVNSQPLKVVVGSTVALTVPGPLTAVESVQAQTFPGGVSAAVSHDTIEISALADAPPQSQNLLIEGIGCVALDCRKAFE